MQLRLPWDRQRARSSRPVLSVAGRSFAVEVVRRRGARRYVVRVTPEATLRLTVPHGAPIAAGLSFAAAQSSWIEREWLRLSKQLAPWTVGTICWYRGERLAIRLTDGRVCLGQDDAGPWSPSADIRAAVTARMRAVAAAELPARCRELAESAGIRIGRVSVRDQRSRWGACSSRGTITLNWRLAQVPPGVRDYIIWHELAHITVPNHSRRFWRLVETLCPAWREHEHWLKAHEREFF